MSLLLLFNGGITARADADTGALVYTGLVPSVTIEVQSFPGEGVATYAGQSPTITITENALSQTDTGVLAYGGLAPAVSVIAESRAGAGVLAYAGLAPSIQITENAASSTTPGVLEYEGFVPSVEGDMQSGGGGIVRIRRRVSAESVAGIGNLFAVGHPPLVVASDTVLSPRPVAPPRRTVERPVRPDVVTVSQSVELAPILGPVQSVPAHTVVMPLEPMDGSVGAGVAAYFAYAPDVVIADRQVADAQAGILDWVGLAPVVEVSDRPALTTTVARQSASRVAETDDDLALALALFEMIDG